MKAVRKKQPTKKKEQKVERVEQKIEERHIEKPEKFLSSINVNGQKILTEKQAIQLLTLRNKKNKPLLILDGEDAQVFELLTRIQLKGYANVWADLEETNGKLVNLEEYFSNKMELQRIVFARKTMESLIVDRSQSGLYECIKCKKEGLESFNTMSTQKATRGDEPPIQNVLCRSCGTRWVER